MMIKWDHVFSRALQPKNAIHGDGYCCSKRVEQGRPDPLLGETAFSVVLHENQGSCRGHLAGAGVMGETFMSPSTGRLTDAL